MGCDGATQACLPAVHHTPVPFCHTTPCNLLQAILMMFNSVAILNNDRFLERCELLLPQRSNADSCPLGVPLTTRKTAVPLFHLSVRSSLFLADGWGFSQMQSSNSLKMSIIGGIHAVHYFRGECVVRCEDMHCFCAGVG